MRPKVIDGDAWLAERIAFLRGLLDGEISEERRAAIEKEVEQLESERERGATLRRLRLLGFPVPPDRL
jgi:hypothetical protein